VVWKLSHRTTDAGSRITSTSRTSSGVSHKYGSMRRRHPRRWSTGTDAVSNEACPAWKLYVAIVFRSQAVSYIEVRRAMRRSVA
jgi:hypothetical protein